MYPDNTRPQFSNVDYSVDHGKTQNTQSPFGTCHSVMQDHGVGLKRRSLAPRNRDAGLGDFCISVSDSLALLLLLEVFGKWADCYVRVRGGVLLGLQSLSEMNWFEQFVRAALTGSSCPG